MHKYGIVSDGKLVMSCVDPDLVIYTAQVLADEKPNTGYFVVAKLGEAVTIPATRLFIQEDFEEEIPTSPGQFDLSDVCPVPGCDGNHG